MSLLIEQTKYLYQVVDQKDVHALMALLHDDVSFHFSNAEPVVGKPAVEAVNAAFFASIKSMTHTFSGIYVNEDTVACEGKVDYVRMNGSAHVAKFATFLSFKQGLIHQYKIFADVSEL
ncbi:nuclear transport factor 2 family protein [Vibrio gallaecicus]|uniref:nuclear transport factor 2 family protein n=1 Tax=Vibrio gallaecicus TaxID=552386 RepID=UPI0010C96173|nr:nuclear transport factor 2 family protein [Vibrio gallaecicus]MDN3613273.1 nuclear transport factor 2 family protein [Vibrio gallaecicus]